MATATVAPQSAGTADQADRVWQVARWLTLVLYAVTVLSVILGGARAESYGELQSALERDAVDQVRVEGAMDGPGGAFASMAGWEVRGAWAYLPMALLVACLGVLMTSPEPRLATRWGWAWLLLSPAIVVAAPAFLVVGARGQVRGRRRLNGVVAFLICVLFIGA